MKRELRVLAAAGWLVWAMCAADAAYAQKTGGILKLGHFDSPASMSMLEESTQAVNRPMSGVFNNLVMFKQDVPQNSLRSIVPDLATSWSWNEEGTELTFPLRQGVKWHDGKPFTATDVKCTVDLLMAKAREKLRINPRKSWFANVAEVTTNGDWEVSFHLQRPQPSFLALLATGWSPIYPCHVSPRDMRKHPIGTGPFKLVDFKPNQSITVTRNPDYWKPGRPYLDGIEYTIIRNLSTAVLAFVAGTFDMTFPYTLTVPLLKDVGAQMPRAICEMSPEGVSRNLTINHRVAPFDKRELGRAMALSLDRTAFIDIITAGHGDIGGVMQPLPEGLWGMPPEILHALPGYGPDVKKSRAEARQIMEQLGYGPGNRLKVKLMTRDLPYFRDPAVLLIDQLKDAYIDGDLEPVDTTNYFPRMVRRDFSVALGAGAGGNDPDQGLYTTYVCNAENNRMGYCNPEVDELIERQSREGDQERRKRLSGISRENLRKMAPSRSSSTLVRRPAVSPM